MLEGQNSKMDLNYSIRQVINRKVRHELNFKKRFLDNFFKIMISLRLRKWRDKKLKQKNVWVSLSEKYFRFFVIFLKIVEFPFNSCS